MQEKARVQRFALLGIKVSSFKYFLGNLYIIIVIISILFYYLCVFRKNRRKFTKPAEFGGKTAGIGCSLIFSESTHIGLSFGTTLNILSQNEDFDGFCLLSNSTTSYGHVFLRNFEQMPSDFTGNELEGQVSVIKMI